MLKVSRTDRTGNDYGVLAKHLSKFIAELRVLTLWSITQDIQSGTNIIQNSGVSRRAEGSNDLEKSLL